MKSNFHNFLVRLFEKKKPLTRKITHILFTQLLSGLKVDNKAITSKKDIRFFIKSKKYGDIEIEINQDEPLTITWYDNN